MTEPSATTSELIRLLTERDAKGRAKYGTTLDRTDLTHAEWLQHMVEELLDAAGYALVAKREADRDADRSIDECIESTKAFIGAVESSNELLAALHRQRTENSVLRDAREVLKREVRALKADVDAMQRTNDDLAAENERLANALGRIATEQSAATAQDAADRFQAIARAAIKGDSHPAARTKEHCND